MVQTRATPPLFLIYACVGVALMLLAGAVVPLVARLILLPADSVREALLEARPVAEADLAQFRSTRFRVLPFFKNNEILNDLALVAMTRAEQAGVAKPEARPWLDEARRWQQAALIASPADTYGWARLAYIHLELSGPSRAAAAALEQSMATGPFEPQLMLTRLKTAFLLYDFLDAETKAQLPSVLRASWHFAPELVAKAAREGHFQSALRDAIHAD